MTPRPRTLPVRGRHHRTRAGVAALGTAVGFTVAVLLLQLTSGLLPALPSTDVASFVVVPLILGVLVVGACVVPALRAARVDPAVVLRA